MLQTPKAAGKGPNQRDPRPKPPPRVLLQTLVAAAAEGKGPNQKDPRPVPPPGVLQTPAAAAERITKETQGQSPLHKGCRLWRQRRQWGRAQTKET